MICLTELLFPLRCQYKFVSEISTCTANSISGVSRLAGTRETPVSVCASSLRVTTSVARCTLVDICIDTTFSQIVGICAVTEYSVFSSPFSWFLYFLIADIEFYLLTKLLNYDSKLDYHCKVSYFIESVRTLLLLSPTGYRKDKKTI